jgi:hypothetical protein
MDYKTQNAAKRANIFYIAVIFMRLIFSRPPIFKVKSDSRNLIYSYNRIPRWNSGDSGGSGDNGDSGKRKISDRGAKVLQKCASPIKILVAF